MCTKAATAKLHNMVYTQIKLQIESNIGLGVST